MAWQSPASSSGGPNIDLGTIDHLFIAAQVAVSVPGGTGFVAGGDNQRVIIHGTIMGTGGGVMGSSSGELTNAQLQIGVTGRLQAVSVCFISYGYARIDNAGAISSFDDVGIFLIDSAVSSLGSRITNSGLIEGATNGIQVSASANVGVTVINSGTISGNVFSFRDSSSEARIDYITNTGTMIGTVDLGGGDDLFDGRLGISPDTVMGGSGNDRIYTGTGSQTLVGGAGNDTLMGGAGADTFFGGNEFDYASYSSAASSVALNLATGGTGGEAAGDVFQFLSAPQVEGVIGSKYADTITGDAAANRLIGGAGNDTLNGGLGIDTLYGQTGQDAFVFSTVPNGTTNYDRLVDYVVADDRIRLDDAAFAGVGAVGALSSGAFVSSPAGLPADASDRIIYNSSSGALYFDSNGTGSGGRVLMAILPTGLAMTSSEFTIF